MTGLSDNQGIRSFIDPNSIETRPFINGAYVDVSSNEFIVKNSTVTGEELVRIPCCNESDTDKAIESAQEAFNSGVWRDKTPSAKKEIILKFASLIEENKEYIARLDTYETGRAFRNYYFDSIPKAIEAVRYFAESIDKIYDVAIPPRNDSFGIVRRCPLGVVAIITPWNDPMVVTMWKVIPALLMGNSVVIKPAEQSSLSAIFVAGLSVKAGIPAGVLNVLPGYGEKVGKYLCTNMLIRGVFFTGSSEVGKKIIGYSSISNMKKVGLECGGKSPYIVTANCKDIDKAAEVLAENMFYNQGQICSAPSRAIVHSLIKDQFIASLCKYSEKYVPGNAFNPDNIVGSIVSKEQYQKVNRYIDIGIKSGAKVYTASSKSDLAADALAVRPTIFYDVPTDCSLLKEEIFGPVIVVIEYENIDEAIQIANDVEYGLAGAVWTDDLDEAYYIASKVESGLIHVNSYGEDDNSSPFGGFKQSGWGKDKSLFAFDEYSEKKAIWIKAISK